MKKPAIIGRLVSEGGWIERPGVATFNLYRPPVAVPGNAANAGRWIELVQRIYGEAGGEPGLDTVALIAANVGWTLLAAVVVRWRYARLTVTR